MSFEPPCDDSHLRYDNDEMDVIYDEMQSVYSDILSRLDEYERAALSQDIDRFTYIYRQRMKESLYE